MSSAFDKLLAITSELEKARIGYKLEKVRDDSIMILARVPGYYWEIDVYDDAHVEVEVFASNGRVEEEPFLHERIEKVIIADLEG